MPYRRFRIILLMLHFAENRTLITKQSDDNYDVLGKIRPIMEMMQERFQHLYSPHHNVSIDEAMIVFKGRISIRQYMPIKPVKYGIKVYFFVSEIISVIYTYIYCIQYLRFFVFRCDLEKGYPWDFQVYRGKEKNARTDVDLGERVVLDLTTPWTMDTASTLTIFSPTHVLPQDSYDKTLISLEQFVRIVRGFLKKYLRSTQNLRQGFPLLALGPSLPTTLRSTTTARFIACHG